MVNHLRTLIVNLPPSVLSENEQFIPSDFKSIYLNNDQTKINNSIFPNSYDRSYINFIATLVSNVCYDSPFKQDLIALDARTLMTNTQPLFVSTLDITASTNASSLIVGGALIKDERLGVFDKSWNLSYSSSTEITILNNKTKESSTATLTFQSNVSSSFELQNSGIQGKLLNVSAVPSNFAATVAASCPMSYNLMSLLDRIKARDCSSLIFNNPNKELRAKMIDYFQDNARPDHSIAAILTAYAYSFSL